MRLYSLAVAALLGAAIGPLAAALADTPTTAKSVELEAYALLGIGEHVLVMDLKDYDVLQRVQKLRPDHERLLWFRVAGKEYVVREAATLTQFEAAWKPLHPIGRRIVAVTVGETKRQGNAVDVEIQRSRITRKLDEIAAKLDDHALPAKERAALGRTRRKLEVELRKAARDMAVLEKQALQYEIDIRELRHQNVEADQKARLDSGAIAARALAKGVAKPVSRP